jgi:hypothetical protein
MGAREENPSGYAKILVYPGITPGVAAFSVIDASSLFFSHAPFQQTSSAMVGAIFLTNFTAGQVFPQNQQQIYRLKQTNPIILFLLLK